MKILNEYEELTGDALCFEAGQTAYIFLSELRYPEKVKLISKHIDNYQGKETVRWLVDIGNLTHNHHKLVNESLLTFDDTKYKNFQVKKELLAQREEIDNKLRKLNV